MTDQQGGIRIGDLLVRAGVVTAADCAEAERLSVEMKAQFGRLLILAGCLTEEALACALEAQAFIKQGVISFDIAIEALAFAVEESMSLEQALELLDLLPQFGTATLELAKLIGEARIVPEDNLIEALEHSVQTNIPLSEVLLAEQLISPDMLGLLTVLHEQIRTNSLDRPLAVKDLRAEYALWRRGNYSTKSSRGKMPAYPQAQEVRKTFHQLRAMQPPQPVASSAQAAPDIRSHAPQPVASSASTYDFDQSNHVPQRSVAPQAMSNSSSAQAFKGLSSELDDQAEDDKSKGLDLDKLQMLKSLAFHAPVGAPLPLLLDDALPAVPIAALQSADHWNSLDATSGSQFSKPPSPPPAAQPSFNPFASGPDFYSEPPQAQAAPAAPAAPQFAPAPIPLQPPAPAPLAPPSSYAVPAEVTPAQSGSVYEIPPAPVGKFADESFDWTGSEPAAPPVEDDLDWSWTPSPEELEEASRSPSRFAWESQSSEQPSIASEVHSKEGHRFAWETEPTESSNISSTPVQPVAPLQSFEPPAAPVTDTSSPQTPKPEPEPEIAAVSSPDETSMPIGDDTVDSGAFFWEPPARKEVAAKKEQSTVVQPSKEALPPPPPLSLPAEESIAALAEATLAGQFAESAVSSSPDVSSLFKWDPPDYSTPPSGLFGGISDPEDEALASLDIETEISEQAKKAGAGVEDPPLTLTPLSLNFERSSFGSKDSRDTNVANAQAETSHSKAPEEPGVEPQPEPEVKVVPEAKIEPEVKVEPEVRVEPEAKIEPEVRVEPEVKVEPEVRVEPEVKVEPVTKKGKKKGKGASISPVDEQLSQTAVIKTDASDVHGDKGGFAIPSLLLPDNPDLLHLLKAANCFVESDLQNAFVASLNDPAVSLELLKLLNVIDKATLDCAARINKLIKDGTVEMSHGVESLTGIQNGEIKHAELTKVLGLDKAKRKPKAKRKR